jgi:uncharacterized protein (DUF58 family)
MARLDQLLRYSQVYTFLQWFRGRHPPEQGRIFLSQRRVYILPTRHGITFALALVLMLIGSINYNLSLGYVLTFLLAGMAIVSILHTFRNLAHLTLLAGRVEPVFAGDTARFVLHAENARLESRHAVCFSCGGEAVTVAIPGNGATAVELPVKAGRRGWLALPRVTIETRFPLGMFRAWSYVQPAMRVLVYPRPDDSPLPVARPRADTGDAVSVGIGTDDFSGLREYQQGDSPRHVAWKAVARGEAMLTKLFSGRASRELVFDWNDLPPGLDEEARLSRLTRWVLLAHEAGMGFGLRLPGATLLPEAGREHFMRCLQALALHGDGR